MSSSPLVSRPAYALAPIAESGLPEGGPAGRGVPLDGDIPGTKTHVKPLDDDGKTEPKDESIHRVDSPREMGKTPSRRDEIDYSEAQPSYMGLGKPQNSPKTKYPYRDAAEFVAGMWRLREAKDLLVPGGSAYRVAALAQTMLRGLNPKFIQKAQSCSVTLKRADVPNLRWIFVVDCGNGAKTVRVKADRKGNVTQFSKLDLHVACSCPAWRWQGPEYHSTTKDYQDPKTPLQGTASAPDIRDPERQNFICKHATAVLFFTKNWAIPPKKKG